MVKAVKHGASAEKKETNMATKHDGQAVVVCTEKRGVFFGYAEDTKGDRITLKGARMCVRWTSAIKGVLGLASLGPDGSCKISPAVAELELRGITCVMTCSPESIERWESAPWAK